LFRTRPKVLKNERAAQPQQGFESQKMQARADYPGRIISAPAAGTESIPRNRWGTTLRS
jgi:hypothetical protein